MKDLKNLALKKKQVQKDSTHSMTIHVKFTQLGKLLKDTTVMY